MRLVARLAIKPLASTAAHSEWFVMKAVPLTRARHAGNFAAALRSKGIPTERYLEVSHLPVGLLEEVDGGSVLSALSMLDFAESAAANSGIRDLGFWAGLMPIEGYGQFGAHVSQASTLYTAIRTYCKTVRTECSEANYYLKRSGPAVWFCHHQGQSNPFLPQHELYALMIMVQVARLALGPQWKPTRIRLQHMDGKSLAENEWLLSTIIEFASAETGIEMRTADLVKPLVKSPARGTSSHTRTPTFPIEPLAALRLLIEMQLRHAKPPSLELSAELAGISTRTVQRYLRTRGTSFSDLVDHVRLDMAEPLIGDTSMSITEIAHEIGYSNVANFSRSFRRLTGMSPRNYRKMALSR